jgi:SAM-dependent methyltransferase
MESNAKIKDAVRKKYGEIARQSKEANSSSCCGSGCCSTEVYNIMTEDYSNLEGYMQDADLGLGCGLPTQFAKIKVGDTVIDLGSGAGNDCFIARAETGSAGKVIGVDFTPAMIEQARNNAEKLGLHNVEFRLGDIERLPIRSDSADLIVSNCVLNLVPDKNSAFKEMFRVLRPGGHFSISDIVLKGNLPDSLKNAVELYVGCVAGALQIEDYLGLLTANGFKNITIQKEKPIRIPDDILNNYLPAGEINSFNDSGPCIFSITVYGEKEIQSCCDPGCCK